MLENQPCKVIDFVKTKPGKTGTTKAFITGINILNGKKIDIIYRASDKVIIPTVNK